MNNTLKISKHYIVFTLVIIILLMNFLFFKNENLFKVVNYIIAILYVAILYVGVTRHRLNYFYTSINSGNKNGISLTFDDGPNAIYTEKILAILEKKNIKATFFIIGKNIPNNENILKKIIEKGHIIGNHSFGHTYWFNSLPNKIIAKEIIKTEKAIEDAIGKKPNYYRTPFGLGSPNVAKGIKKAKVCSIGWDFRSFDTMAKDENKLLEKLKKNAKKSSIYLLHDNNQFTLNVLEAFIDYCIANGIEIVSLDKMIDIRAYK